MSDKELIEEEEEIEEPLTFAQKFLRLFNKMGDLFILNVYFTASIIPIFTIGAAFTALYTVTNKMVKDKEGTLKTEYWKAFKANLKQGSAIWIFDLVIFGIIFYLMLRMNNNYINQTSSPVELTILTFLVFGSAIAMPLQFPLLARYENTAPMIIINSIVLAISNFGTWFRLFFMWMLPVALYYFYVKALVYTWFLWAMLLTAVFAYISSSILLPFYEKIEKEEADREQAKEEAKAKVKAEEAAKKAEERDKNQKKAHNKSSYKGKK